MEPPSGFSCRKLPCLFESDLVVFVWGGVCVINQGSLYYHALPPPHVMNLRIPPTLTGCHHQSLRSGRHTLFRTSGAHCVLCSLPTFRFPDRALYSEIAPGAGVGACGFSSDVLMRGSQAGDLNLALTTRQCGREEGSYTPHSRRHWLVEQSSWGLATPPIKDSCCADWCLLGGEQ